MSTERTHLSKTSHRKLSSHSLTRELLEWVCHQTISCIDSQDRIELAANLLEHLYNSYLDIRKDKTDDMNLNCKLSIVDCMLHICDRQAFDDDRKSAEYTVERGNSRVMHVQNAITNRKSNEEHENDDMTVQGFWQDNRTLESFTTKRWKLFWEKLHKLWNNCTDSQKEKEKNFNDMYRNIQVKIQLYIILSWKKEKQEREQGLDFSDEEDQELESIISSNMGNDIYIGLAKSILQNNKEGNENNYLLKIFQLLLEQKEIQHNCEGLREDYLRNEMSLLDFQTDVQSFLQILYHNCFVDIPKLVLIHQQKVVNFGSSDDFYRSNAVCNHVRKETTEGSERDQLSDFEDYKNSDTFAGDLEEQEIIKNRKISKQRKKRKHFSTEANKITRLLPGRNNATPLHNHSKSPSNENDENFNSCNSHNQCFTASQGSIGSKTTQFYDMNTILLLSGRNEKQHKKEDKMPKVIRTRERKRIPRSTIDCGAEGSLVQNEEYASGLTLGSLPEKLSLPRRKTNSQSQTPNNLLNDSPPTAIPIRRKWTVEEKMAVKLGVAELGVGKWSEIREIYKHILQNRTNVNIKDCYRTMLNRGEIE